MTQQPYSYVVLRYVPDRGAEEALNVGVVVYSEHAPFLGYIVDSHYEWSLARDSACLDGFRAA